MGRPITSSSNMHMTWKLYLLGWAFHIILLTFIFCVFVSKQCLFALLYMGVCRVRGLEGGDMGTSISCMCCEEKIKYQKTKQKRFWQVYVNGLCFKKQL